jgi:serine/threonine-protein kinase RsbW
MSSLETIGEPGQLVAVTEFVRKAARDAGFDESEIHPVDLIVEEVFLNIALHGYPRDSPGPVVIECASPESGILTIRFSDQAHAFNPLAMATSAPDLPIEQRCIGGLGLVLVRRLADSVTYKRTDDGNELSVRIAARKPIGG